MNQPAYEYEGLDFQYLMREALTYPVFEGMAEPKLMLKQMGEPERRRKGVVGGWARYQEHTVTLNVWPEARRMRVLSTLLHELVHLRLGPGVGHRHLFKRTFQEAAQQVYGLRVPWASCSDMSRYVQWGLAEMANRGFWESIMDAQEGRWHPPVPEWWPHPKAARVG